MTTRIMTIWRVGMLPLSFFLLAFSAPPSFATIMLYDNANQAITPFLTCNSSTTQPLATTYPYQAACDYKNQNGIVDTNENNPSVQSITYIANTLDPSLVVNRVVDLATKYDFSGTATLTGGDPNILSITLNVDSSGNQTGTWSINNYDFPRWMTLKWNGLYHVYDVTNIASGAFFADSSMQISNMALYGFVPVPAAVWLFGSAIAGLAILRRRRLSQA